MARKVHKKVIKLFSELTNRKTNKRPENKGVKIMAKPAKLSFKDED